MWLCCCSVAKLCTTLCDPMDCSTPGFPVFHSHPWSWWCHLAISSSVIPFSSCFQSFPASVSFPVSWLFISGGQSIRASAWASALPMIDWFDLLTVQGTLKSLLQHHSLKASVLQGSAFFMVQLSNLTPCQIVRELIHNYIWQQPHAWKLWFYVEAEAPILWPPDSNSWLMEKDPDAGKDWRQKEKRVTEETVGWHHWFSGHELG